MAATVFFTWLGISYNFKSKKISIPSSLNFFKPSVPQIAYSSLPILTPAMWSLSFLAVSSAFSKEFSKKHSLIKACSVRQFLSDGCRLLPQKCNNSALP